MNECEHKWRDYSEYGGDYEKTPVVCRDCGTPAPPEVVASMLVGALEALRAERDECRVPAVPADTDTK